MEKLKILHMYPNMLDLYGDSGNVEVLSYRCKMRGIELEVSKHLIGDKETDFTQYDIIYLGGGADFEQQILADDEKVLCGNNAQWWHLPIKDADVLVISSSRLSLTEKNTRS